MALATLGAFIALAVTLAINRVLQRDFNAEWADSFKVKHPDPMGEVAIARMLNED
jgi:putative membrane protein